VIRIQRLESSHLLLASLGNITFSSHTQPLTMDPLGNILDIAHILKRAYDIYKGCQSAPEEIQLAAEHVHAMTLVLEGVKSDLVGNQASFVNQSNAIAKTRLQRLVATLKPCDRALMSMDALLTKYRKLEKGHVSFWNNYRWSTDGKKEIAECKYNLMAATHILEVFLQTVNAGVLWRMERILEAWDKGPKTPQKSAAFSTPPRANTNPQSALAMVFKRTLRASIFCIRLQRLPSPRKTRHVGNRRPKAVTRVNSGFSVNKNRNALMNDYAFRIVNDSTDAMGWKTQQARSPSPDFYLIDPVIPKPIRRASTMRPIKYYECWRVGFAALAIGLKSAPQYVQHKRGQPQICKMASMIAEVGTAGGKVLSQKDKRVELLLKAKNKEEQKKVGGKKIRRKWSYVAGRDIKSDVSKTGMFSVEKALIIIVGTYV
jgi:hypothetical protein